MTEPPALPTTQAKAPVNSNNKAADIEMERDWNNVQVSRDYILFPNRPPYKRKGKNRWTDANEADIAKQLINDKVDNLDTSNPALLIN